MFARGRYMTPHEYNWNHFSINRFLFAILLLTSSVEIIADSMNLIEGRSSHENNCMIYRSCTQCNDDVSFCSWLIEKQICIYSNQSLSEESVVDTKQSCPEFAVTYNRSLIQVTVSNIVVKSVKTFFHENANIGCEIGNATYSASINNGVIICEQVGNKIIFPKNQSISGTNPLFIYYFSIVINNIRLQFNDPRDHYISYHGRTCPNENCTIRFWESDSRKYYCKWCLKNDVCKITGEQLNSCDIRNTINNDKWKDPGLPSMLEVSSPDVEIESFKPDVILFHREMPTVIAITVKNLHWILANGQSMNVTIAGKTCDNLATFDGQTVNCNISTNQTVNEGPVVIEYEWMKSVKRLKSAQNFRFVEPKFTHLSPMCLPASGGGQIKLFGEYLNTTADIQVFFQNTMTKAMCEIVELANNSISCVTTAKPEGPRSGKLQISFENWFGRYYKDNKLVTFVSDPTVLDGQVFEGVTSGDVPLTVQGSFKCTKNHQMYVDYNETRYYGHCALLNTSVMVCWPPKLDDPVQMASLPLGFRVDLAGKVVHLPQQTALYRYLLYPDPVYTDFEVYDQTVVRVAGVFPDLLQRRRVDGSYYMLEVTFYDDEMDDDERFIVTNVTDNSIECQSPSDKSVADVLEIAITVGKKVKRTVIHRRHKQYYAIVRLLRPQYVLVGISALLTCVFALIFCVKKIMNNSKGQMDKRYIEELRNITAGIDDTTDYLLNSNTEKTPKTCRY
ncbi:hypothetical protein ACI65C_012813 [Semiaphis heraclei]